MVSLFKKGVAYVLVLALMLMSASGVFAATGSVGGGGAYYPSTPPAQEEPETPAPPQQDEPAVEDVTVEKDGVKAEAEVDTEANTATINDVESDKKIVKVPAKVEGAKVTVIGAGAFKGCENATKVVLPKSVTKIEKNAFKGAKKLKNIDLKIKKSIKVEKGAFKGLKTKKMTIKVGKMSKKELKKFKKELKNAGFNGKVKVTK